MRKIKMSHPVFILALFSAAFFNSCKKESSDVVNPQISNNERLIPMIKSWLDKEKINLSASSSAKIDSLKLNLNYDGLRLEKYKESKELIVVPILSGFKSKNNSDKNPANYLVLVFENKDSITRGNIIQYISSNNQKVVPQNTFNKIFTYKDIECSGQFTILSITDYFKYELKFENGNLKSLAEVKKRELKKKDIPIVSGRINECVDWYWQTWFVWSDGSATLESEVYVFTTCDGDCAQPRIANGRSFSTNCGGGTGGGGGNPIEYEYAVSRYVDWTVRGENEGPGGGIMSSELIKGKRATGYPGGGHFTSISHWSTWCTSCSTNNPNDIWIEDSNTKGIGYLSLTVWSRVIGHLNYNGVTYNMNSLEIWEFQEVF